MLNLDEDCKKFFPNFKHKLNDCQEKAITSALKDNTLCIMPTGGGKSMIYKMAALEKGGVTLVISPLIALIAEQVQKIENAGYKCLAFHSGINSDKQAKSLMNFANGTFTPNFIFVSPERIATDGFFEYSLKLRKDDIKLVVIDEVHCVSQWGISFRPFYKRIPNFMDRLFGADNWATILALTATLNPQELKDICADFKISPENIVKDSSLMRSEIQIHVQKFESEEEKEKKFWEIVNRHRNEKTLVYVYRKYNKRSVEELCEQALAKGYRATFFHGDMSAAERMRIISDYKNNLIDIIFATNAFGMGINIPDIRTVIHFMMPDSAEQFYQEIGRAARDGHSANAYLLYSDKNIEVKRTYFIDGSFPDKNKLIETYKKLGGKVGYKTLQYFDDEDIQNYLHYYIESGAVEIICKGFISLSNLEEIQDDTLQRFFDSTKTKNFIRTVNNNKILPAELAETVYKAVINGRVKLNSPLKRCLIIDLKVDTLSDEQLEKILSSIEEKRNYKHELLDWFVKLLKNNLQPNELHQEIAAYLGMNKFLLNQIYTTSDGNLVRSKSEVIISNLLSAAGINYCYEEKLFYEDGKYILPDFTIYLKDGTKIFWEHVGMLGSEKYDERWTQKLDVYEKFFPNQMKKTYESGAIVKDAEKLIDELKILNQ